MLRAETLRQIWSYHNIWLSLKYGTADLLSKYEAQMIELYTVSFNVTAKALALLVGGSPH